MNQENVNRIMYQMTDYLDNYQLMQLKKVLEDVSNEKFDENDSEELLAKFLANKKLEGRSERTLVYYKNTIEKMINTLNINVRAITTDDLRMYLSDYQNDSKASKASIDNIRRNLSSFFGWLEDENYILKSPVRRIHKIKTTTVVKEAYSDDEMENLRDACREIRDLALIDMLSSTGMRIGELVQLNIKDINFDERECIVLGKGDKERIVYFDARTKIHLQEYVDSRDDDNEACNRRGLYLPEDGYNSWKNCRDFEMDKHTANYEEKLIKAMKFGYKPPKLEEKKNSPLKAVPEKNRTTKDIASSAGREKKDLGGYSIFPFEGKLKDTTSEKVRCGYFIFGIKQKKVPAFLCEKSKMVYISQDCFQKYHDEISAHKLYLWFD